MTAFTALLRKDLRVELRTLRSLPAMVLFAVTAFVIFRFGLDREQLSGELAAGVLVPTLLFAAILGINRLFVAEREEGGFDLVRLAPIDRTVLFAAKASALVIYLVVLELVAVPIFALFFLDSASGLLPFALILLLADIGLAATGTVIGGRGRAPAGRRWPRLRALRYMAWIARPLRFDLPPGRLRHLRFPAGRLGRDTWPTRSNR